MVRSPTVPGYDALAVALGARATRHRPLGALTTYGVGGPAELFVEVDGPDDLRAVRTALIGSGVAVYVIGRGSNLLVADSGFDGVVLRLGQGFNTVLLPDPVTGSAPRSWSGPEGPRRFRSSPGRRPRPDGPA